MPGVMDNLRVTMGWAWTYLVVAGTPPGPARDGPLRSLEQVCSVT